MTYKDIMQIVPVVESAWLLGANVDYLTSKKKKTAKGLIGLGIGNVVGATVIKSTADVIGGM